MELVEDGEDRWRIPRQGGMLVDGLVFASRGLIVKAREDRALQQVANVAHLPGIVGYSLAMPDIHWGYGFPIGGVAATRLDGLSAAVCYYGGQIAKFADEKPKCPTQMHFGEIDQSIPISDVEMIKKKRPDCEIYTYPDAPHGFHCDERASYREAAAKTAWPRTMEFLNKHVKK